MIRKQSHSGSWYEQDHLKLTKMIDAVISPSNTTFQVLIGPHAGHKYSSKTLGKMYSSITKTFKRVILLGPSHYKSIAGCFTTMCSEFETPVGNIKIDQQSVNSLQFDKLSIRDEEQEHSLEIHLPFIKHLLPEALLLPIYVGSLNHESTQKVCQVLSPILMDSLVVVSSDFCHWGTRFHYQPSKAGLEIHDYIKQLDMDAIDSLKSTTEFESYLKATRNTICGRQPILLVLNLLKHLNLKIKTELLFYDQSSKVMDLQDSSVSYAAVALC